MLVWAYGKYTPDYPLNEYIGYVLGSLALAGVFYLLLPAFNRRFHSVAARFRVFESVRPSGEAQFFLPLLALTLLAVRLYADIGGVCLLGPCRRTVPALALTALLLAAIGFYSFIAFLNRLLASVSPRPYRILRAAIFLLVLVFLIHQLSTHPFHYARDPVRGLYHNIEFDELPAIAWLKARSKPSEVLFALPWTAKAVYLLADRKVVDTGAARLGAGLHGLQDIVNFFLVDCAAKEATLLRRKSDWIYAGKGYVDCPSLDQVLSSGGNYVYVQNG